MTSENGPGRYFPGPRAPSPVRAPVGHPPPPRPVTRRAIFDPQPRRPRRLPSQPPHPTPLDASFEDLLESRVVRLLEDQYPRVVPVEQTIDQHPIRSADDKHDNRKVPDFLIRVSSSNRGPTRGEEPRQLPPQWQNRLSDFRRLSSADVSQWSGRRFVLGFYCLNCFQSQIRIEPQVRLVANSRPSFENAMAHG